jgi:hypothetical protein
LGIVLFTGFGIRSLPPLQFFHEFEDVITRDYAIGKEAVHSRDLVLIDVKDSVQFDGVRQLDVGGRQIKKH